MVIVWRSRLEIVSGPPVELLLLLVVVIENVSRFGDAAGGFFDGLW